MPHDDHFHCFDHGASTLTVKRTDTYLRGKRRDPGLTFYSLKKDLFALAARSGGLLSVVTLGKTPGGRDILLARLGTNFKTTKPKTLLTAGLHAREWIGPSYVYLVAEWLIDNQSNFAAQAILNQHHVLFVPMVNPDGHEYTVTTDRFFRKNSPAGDNDFFKLPTDRRAAGRQKGAPESVDLNRNFDSPNRAAVLAAGRGQFSLDPDTDEFVGTGTALETNVMQKLITRENPDALIDHHAFGCFCMHSPGDDQRPLSAIDPVAAPRFSTFLTQIKNLLDTGAARNLTTGKTPDTWTAVQASNFYFQLAAQLGHPIAAVDSLVPGGIDDFAFYNSTPPAKQRALGFTLELPPMSTGGLKGFDLPETAIRPVFKMCLGATLAFITLCAVPNPQPSQFGVFNLII